MVHDISWAQGYTPDCERREAHRAAIPAPHSAAHSQKQEGGSGEQPYC